MIDFKDQCVLNISDGRTMRYLQSLLKVDKWVQEGLTGADKQKIKKMIARVEREDYSAKTKKMYRNALRKFYQFREGYEWREEYPAKVDWISTTIKKNNEKLPEELLSQDDVKELIRAAKNPRDRLSSPPCTSQGVGSGNLIL